MNGGPYAISGSQFDLQPVIRMAGTPQTKSTSNKLTTFFAVFFFITTILFVILFVVFYVKYKDKDTSIAGNDGNICDTPDCRGQATISPGQGTTCYTQDCLSEANRILQKMNLNADPCEDFNEFACGRFLKESIIPDGSGRVSSFTQAEEETIANLKSILTGYISTSSTNYVDLLNAKEAYEFCINEGKSNQEALNQFLDNTKSSAWPTINSYWSDTYFDVSAINAQYSLTRVEPLYTFYVLQDYKNNTNYAVYLTQPKLGLPREYFARPRNDTIIMAYQNYLSSFAVKLGATKSVADQDAKDVVDLEIALSNILVSKEDTRDEMKLYNPTKLNLLSYRYPGLGIAVSVRTLFTSYGVSLLPDQLVVDQFPQYIGNISQVLQKFSNRVKHNLYGFKFAIYSLSVAHTEFATLRRELNKLLQGINGETPTSDRCVRAVAQGYPNVMESEYLKKFPISGYKNYIDDLNNNLREVFKQMFQANTWVGVDARSKLIRKINDMKFGFKFPSKTGGDSFESKDSNDFVDSDKDTDDGKGHKAPSEDTLKDAIKNNKEFRKRFWTDKHIDHFYSNIRGRERPTEDESEKIAAFDANAYYMGVENSINLLPGILRPPFFSLNAPAYANYGSLGMIIAHEITHGFDDKGLQFDDKGNLKSWIPTSDLDSFTQRMMCIINQTSDFYSDEIKMNLNGLYTQGECLADNIGIKNSFKAYKDYTNKHGEQLPLPNINLTPDQIFFVKYAQVWCEKSYNQTTAVLVNTDVHPPGKYRIFGPLQNSEEFAKAYNCPKGSFMNPEKKCSVW